MKRIISVALLCLCCGLLVSGSVIPVPAQDLDPLQQVQELSDSSIRNWKAKTSVERLEEERSKLLEAWHRNSQNGNTAYGLGKIHYLSKEYNEAIPWFQKAIRLKTRFIFNSHYFLAEIYTLQGNRLEAIRMWETTIDSLKQREKEGKVERKRKGWFPSKLIDLYIEEKDYESALKHAYHWKQLEPNYAKVQEVIEKLEASIKRQKASKKEKE